MSKRECETCKWADISSGARVIRTADNVTIYRNGGCSIICQNKHIKSVTFDASGNRRCSGYERKELPCLRKES